MYFHIGYLETFVIVLSELLETFDPGVRPQWNGNFHRDKNARR